MRVITGIYKGRHFDIPRTFKARPTTDFAKENIFNVLNGYIDFEGALALDLFAGTGSITLEMLSRGCRQVVSIEADRDHYAFIKQCLKKINDTNGVVIRGDVFKFVKNDHIDLASLYSQKYFVRHQLVISVAVSGYADERLHSSAVVPVYLIGRKILRMKLQPRVRAAVDLGLPCVICFCFLRLTGSKQCLDRI